MSKENFTKRLIDLMKDKKMTVRAAAEYAGVAPSTLQSWRSGTQPTDFQALRRLCKHLDVSLSYLLTGEDDNISPDQFLQVDDTFFEGYALVSIKKLIPK